jgi:hypothetical protein
MKHTMNRWQWLEYTASSVVGALVSAKTGVADVGGAEKAAKRGRVIAACTRHWPDNKGDCSAFVKAVAHDVGLDVTGQANNIYDLIAESPWIRIGIGDSVATVAGVTAGEGNLVIAAKKDQPNGHVAIVVDYRNAFDSYKPVDRDKAVALRGSLHSVGQEYMRITQSWKASDLKQVLYAYRPIP